MRLRTIGDYQFVNWSTSDRYGFTHHTTLFKNNYEISSGKARWCNRTWEAYTYQTSMMNAVYNLIKIIKDRIKYDYMKNMGYTKLTAKRKEELEEFYNQDAEIVEYTKLYDELNKR